MSKAQLMLKKYLYYFLIWETQAHPTLTKNSAQDSQLLLAGTVPQTCELASTAQCLTSKRVTSICEMVVVFGLTSIISC